MKEQFLEKDDEYIDTFDVAVETHWRVNTLSNKAHTHQAWLSLLIFTRFKSVQKDNLLDPDRYWSKRKFY